MIAPARNAYATARVRARKSALLGGDARARLLAAPDPPALARVLADSGLPLDGLAKACWSRLGEDYARVARSVAKGVDVVVELLRRHELENLKLVIRARANGWPTPRWAPLWRPLGPLAELDAGPISEAPTWEVLQALLEPTPYASPLAEVRAPTVSSAPKVEQALDGWMSRRLAQVAEALPEKEETTRALLRLVVLERDLALISRAGIFGLEEDEARAQRATTHQRQDPGTVVEARRLRLRTCLRAFRESALRLAPSIAYLLLRDEEVRGLLALQAACGVRPTPAVLDEVLAASQLGVG